MARRTLLVLAAAALSSACAPSLLPGTEVPDTRENREIMKVVELYRQAVERRDATAILDLVAPSYFDERGHPDDASFHWNFERLARDLPKKFEKVNDVRLTITVRRIEVDQERAKVSYLYVEDYIAKLPQGETPEHASDIDRMELVRSGKRWLITKGI